VAQGMKKILIGLLIATVFIGVIGLVNYLFPVDRAAIEVAAEAIFEIPTGLANPLVINIFGISMTLIPTTIIITNAFFTSILLSLIILVIAFFVGRGLKEQPGNVQNIVEFMIESMDGLVTSIAPKKWAATFFPILATIFIYLLFANWLSLFTPLLGSFGLIHPTDHGGIPVENVIFLRGSAASLHHEETESHSEGEAHPQEGESAKHGEADGQQVKIVPLFRAPSSDLNLTLALALVTMVLVQIFGIREHGLFPYLGIFIRVNAFKKGFWMGLIDFIIGLIEGISELAKIISFSFRLFGNIFAGEVVLIVISSLVSLFLVVIFFGFEIFVGFIQAFVFFILSLMFFSLATQHHGEEH
jgi:F-type H+-transporting ATPase subunit a